MSEPFPRRMSADLMGKLHRLAERRQAHFDDLHRTGRWRNYYSEGEFATVMRDVVQSAEHWKRIAAPTAE